MSSYEIFERAKAEAKKQDWKNRLPKRFQRKKLKVIAKPIAAGVYVSGEIMTNQSLRDRFGIEERNYSTASRIISEAKSTGLIRDYDPDNRSKTYAKYLPFLEIGRA